MATNATTHEPTVKDINDDAKKELIEIIHSQFEMIETMMTNCETMNDGNYLTLTNNLQKLFNITERFKTNTIYRVYERHSRRPTRGKDERTYEQKLKNSVPCPRCGRLLTDEEAIKVHQKREICVRIEMEKRGALFTGNAIRKEMTPFENGIHILNDWYWKVHRHHLADKFKNYNRFKSFVRMLEPWAERQVIIQKYKEQSKRTEKFQGCKQILFNWSNHHIRNQMDKTN